MPLGLAFFDRDLRLILSNTRYQEMLGLPARVARRGTSLRQLVQYGVARGMHPGLDADAVLGERLALFAEGRPASLLTRLKDGRTLETSYRPIPDGGWAYELRSEWSDATHDAQNIAWTRAAIAEVIETRSCRAA